MKHILKQAEPPALTGWKLLENEDWQPTYETLSGDTKKAVIDALMDEQGMFGAFWTTIHYLFGAYAAQ